MFPFLNLQRLCDRLLASVEVSTIYSTTLYGVVEKYYAVQYGLIRDIISSKIHFFINFLSMSRYFIILSFYQISDSFFIFYIP